MAAPQQSLSPELARGLREIILMGLAHESETTKKVLGAVLDSKRDFRLDPKARTAWELAWHLASADVQLTDEVAHQKFSMEPRFKQKPKTVKELVDWYDKQLKRARGA